MDILYTVLIGMGTVFFGLVCLIALIKLMHLLLERYVPETKKEPEKPQPPAPEIPEIDHDTLVVLAATAVAEEQGTDISAIRIHAIRRI